jgi:hypothetical protein
MLSTVRADALGSGSDPTFLAANTVMVTRQLPIPRHESDESGARAAAGDSEVDSEVQRRFNFKFDKLG